MAILNLVEFYVFFAARDDGVADQRIEAHVKLVVVRELPSY